jgi:hypothetical protein
MKRTATLRKLEALLREAEAERWSLDRCKAALGELGCELESQFAPEEAARRRQKYVCAVSFPDMDPFTDNGVTVEVILDHSGQVVSAIHQEWLVGW